MKTSDIAYAAGFFDGEGCLSVNQTHPHGTRSSYIRSQLVVGNTDPRVVRWLKETFRVGIVIQRKAQHRNWKRCWVWHVSGREAVRVIRELLPYLKLKQRQARLFIRLVDLKRNSNRWGAFRPRVQNKIMREIHRLNRRGR